MPRKYQKRTKTGMSGAASNAFAEGFAASMRPLIDEIVTEKLNQIAAEWLARNAPSAPEPLESPELGSPELAESGVKLSPEMGESGVIKFPRKFPPKAKRGETQRASSAR